MNLDTNPPMEAASLQKQLPDQAGSYVRELVISGSVRPGEFLRLEPIAAALGISITPVREGLRMLQNEGLVRLVPRRGFVVESVTEQDIHDIFWSQAKIAGELVARAAERITEAQLAELDELNKEYERAAKENDSESMARIGHHFHARINHAANSRRLALLLASVTNQLPRRFYASIEGNGDDSREQHPRITEFLRKGEGEKARLVMEEHLLISAKRLIEELASRGMWDKPAEA